MRKPQAAPAGAARATVPTVPSHHRRMQLTQTSEPKNESSIKSPLTGRLVIAKGMRIWRPLAWYRCLGSTRKLKDPMALSNSVVLNLAPTDCITRFTSSEAQGQDPAWFVLRLISLTCIWPPPCVLTLHICVLFYSANKISKSPYDIVERQFDYLKSLSAESHP